MILEPLRKAIKILMIFSIILTIAVIFYNSTVPPKESVKQSNAMGQHMAQVIPPKDDGAASGSSGSSSNSGSAANKDVSFDFGKFVQENIRNIAHFMEYGLLGAEMVVYILMFVERKKLVSVLSVIGAFGIACIDEFIQRFSGRNPDMEDVILDVAGYVSIMILSYLIALVFVLLSKLASAITGVKSSI